MNSLAMKHKERQRKAWAAILGSRSSYCSLSAIVLETWDNTHFIEEETGLAVGGCAEVLSPALKAGLVQAALPPRRPLNLPSQPSCPQMLSLPGHFDHRGILCLTEFTGASKGRG